MAVVTRKNFCRLILTLPLTNITPKKMATITPLRVPMKLISSVEFSVTAERMRTVSTPSRSTIRKTKRNSPNYASSPGEEADFAFNFSFEFAAGLHHENDHGDNEDRGGQHDPAFENIFVQIEPGNHDGQTNGAGKGGAERGIDRLAQVVAADLGQVRQRDADDQSGFDAFAERNDECLQHGAGGLVQLELKLVENEFHFQYG